MKTITAVLLLTVATAAAQQKGTQAEQTTCYKQSQRYVTDVNEESSGIPTYFLRRAHYSPVTKTCYVLLNASYQSGPNFVVDWHLADANEATDIGSCREGQSPASDSKPSKRFVFQCDFRKHTVNGEDDWQDLVSKELSK